MAGEREVRIKFTGNSAPLKGAAGDIRKVFQQLTDDENDTRTAAEKLAEAQKVAASKMRAQMKEVSAAADVLADALGPEMVKAMETSGKSVEDLVIKYQKMGLTLDDVRANADSLAAGERDLDDAMRQGSGNIGDGMKKVAEGTDKARSAYANFAGNIVQEMPGVAGAFGPVNMAISQVVEGIAEGEIGLKGLLGGAAMMAGAFAAFEVVSTVVDGVKDLGTWEREAAKRAEEMKVSALNAADGLDVQTIATLNTRDATVAYSDAMRENSDNAVRDAIVQNEDFLDTMLRYGVTMDEVIAATHSHTAATELNNKMTAKAVEMGDQAYSQRAGHRVNALNAEGEALNELSKFLWRNADANDAATQSLVKLAKAGDLIAIEYLKTTGQWDLLTLAEQRAAQAALDKAAADDVATKAARERSAATVALNTALGQGSAHSGTAGGRVQAIEGEQHTTINFVVNDQTVQQITHVQKKQAKGMK